MCVCRCLRKDKVTEAVQDFVSQNLGPKFIEPPTFDLPGSFKDSGPTIPLIFVLSAGADPAAELFRFAEEMRFSKKLIGISLGQGQGPIAEKLIQEGMEKGTWVLLQNCHLATSWMPSLERIIENFAPEKIHRDFRLWLTSMPSASFPVSVLQNSVKMTNEPPKGLKANLRGSFAALDDKFLDDSKKPGPFRQLLFALCFFHAQIQERRKFGPLGWNIRYEFTAGDLNVCMTQLRMFLDKYEEVPFKVLKFLFAQINYGGRVTDDWDRRTLLTMQDFCITPDALQDGFAFSESGLYKTLPGPTDYAGYMEYLNSLPINAAPEVFGLHENADITCAQAETKDMMDTILSLQPRASGGSGSSREDVIESVSKDILSRIPDPWLLHEVGAKYPTNYNESMNTVLVQEVIRYNKLIVVMKKSLKDILNALKGLVVMSGELEAMGTSLFNNQVPKMWASKAYPSLKGLSAWTVDLQARLQFVNSWIVNGIPPVYWISGLFFPQAFLTGTLQNFARKYQVSIDTVSFEFRYMTENDFSEKAPDGCYVRGMFLEGARWDNEAQTLVESRPRELFTEMPIIWLKPVANRVKPDPNMVYICPLYRTLERKGVLTTTGHSSCYVMPVEVPTLYLSPQHWIRRGAALFLSLA
jgi:dynein heavy chain